MSTGRGSEGERASCSVVRAAAIMMALPCAKVNPMFEIYQWPMCLVGGAWGVQKERNHFQLALRPGQNRE